MYQDGNTAFPFYTFILQTNLTLNTRLEKKYVDQNYKFLWNSIHRLRHKQLTYFKCWQNINETMHSNSDSLSLVFLKKLNFLIILVNGYQAKSIRGSFFKEGFLSTQYIYIYLKNIFKFSETFFRPFLGLAELFKMMNWVGPTRPYLNALWRLIFRKI